MSGSYQVDGLVFVLLLVIQAVEHGLYPGLRALETCMWPNIRPIVSPPARSPARRAQSPRARKRTVHVRRLRPAEVGRERLQPRRQRDLRILCQADNND